MATVPLIFGVQAILCLCLMGMLIVAINKHRRIQTTDRRMSLADMLNYSSVIEDGIVLCKNGALMAAWAYTARDQESCTEAQMESDASLLNRALAELGDGWMIHVDAVRKATPHYISRGQSHFPHWLPAVADEERRRFFESHGDFYEGYFVLTVTYLPPMLAQTKFVDLMYEQDGGKVSASARGQKILEGFKKDILLIESRLSAVFSLQRLASYTVQR